MIRDPSSKITVGPSRSGKTHLAEELLTEDSVFERGSGLCHYCY